MKMNTQPLTTFIINLMTIINILFLDYGSAAPVLGDSNSEAIALIRARNAYVRLLEREVEPRDVVEDSIFAPGDPETWFIRRTDAE